MTEPDWTRTYDAYAEAASCPDPEQRLSLLRACAVDNLEILSPFPYRVKGVEAVCEQLGKIAASMPDGRVLLRRTSGVDAHNGVFRVGFENCRSDGQPLVNGVHVVDTEGDRIARIIVFSPEALPNPAAG